jgi:hypothetical protein
MFANPLTLSAAAGIFLRPVVLAVISANLLNFSIVGQEFEDGPHFGLLYDRFSLTLREGTRSETLGPIIGWEEAGSGTLLSISPVFSLYRDSVVEQTEAELLYPLLAFDRFGSEYRFHLFQVIAFAGGESLQGDGKKRTTFFPLYFRQKANNPDDNYTAIVPFYGRLKNRLFRDRVFFVMLPLYLQTEKRGMVTDNYVFPFFHRRHGAGVTGWQFWPLIGKEHKEITTTTNHWGDQVVSGGYDKFSLLWPFYFNNTLGIGTTNVQKQFVLLPFYASLSFGIQSGLSGVWLSDRVHENCGSREEVRRARHAVAADCFCGWGREKHAAGVAAVQQREDTDAAEQVLSLAGV